MSIKGFSIGGNVERYDYNALDNIPSEITIDTALSDSSTNPVQNKVVTGAINATTDSVTVLSGEVSDLKSAFSNIKLIKNLITDVVEDKVTSVASIGAAITFVDNSDYGYALIPVNEGTIYSLNNTNYNNSFSWVVDANGNALNRLREYKYNGINSVYQMPTGARYVYLCGGEFKSSNTSRYSVVLETSDVITDMSVYSLANFPYGAVRRVVISKLYDETRNMFAEDVITDIYDKIDELDVDYYFNSYYFQYIDKAKWENGYYWVVSGGNLQKIANASYNAYPPFRLKAGSYHVLNLSGSFSFAVYDDSTRATFSSLVSDNILTLPYDATVYVSNSNITYSMLSTGELIFENGLPVFVSGKYHLSTKQIFYVGSTRPIKTLKEGIEKATEYFDSIVMVDAEDFDLVAEFGQNYLDSYSDTSKMIGLWLKNRVHVVFASGARVLFNYTGSNTVVQTNFSPFNAGDYGFTLENAWVVSKNCRYSVHDELNSSEIPYQNVYKHCTFIHDSSTTTWGAHQAIGGGLGLHGDILIEDCYASSVGAVAANQPIVSYHNATSQTAESKSNIVVRGCRFEGTFRCTNQGKSTTKSRATVTNCSLLSEPYAEITITEQRADNMELYKWNNEIRNA